MSTNHYVYTPGGQEVHLGKSAAGWTFMFRGYPERGVVDYASWRALLDLGEIRTEAGAPLTAAEMEGIVECHRTDWRTRPRQPLKDQLDDANGNRFTLVEFC